MKAEIAIRTFVSGMGLAQVAAGGIADAGIPMEDPKLDDPTKPWCYFTHPGTRIGRPWQPDPIGIQVQPVDATRGGRCRSPRLRPWVSPSSSQLLAA